MLLHILYGDNCNNVYLLFCMQDGLVCLFDLHSMEEEDALISVKNSEASVSNVGFSGAKSEYVYCLTHEEGFVIWSTSEVSVCDRILEVEAKYII